MAFPALPTFGAGSAPVSLANLARGSAVVAFNGAYFYARGDMLLKHVPNLAPEKNSLYGQVDKTKRGLVVKNTVMLFGLVENLTTLFPSWALNPVIGASLFAGDETPLCYLAQNNDRITYRNTVITGLPALYLGVDNDFFAAAVEFTAIIGKGCFPTDAGAYYIRDTANYAEPGFSMSNFVKTRWVGVWGTKTGFGAIVPQKGVQISWQLAKKEITTDGYGVTDIIIDEDGLVGGCRVIPIGPTLAQIDTAQAILSQDIGGRLSANAADLTWTGGAHSVVLKQSAIVESSTAFGVEPLRVGELGFETTRGFSAGVPQAVATVA